jgi:hypothetical protein
MRWAALMHELTLNSEYIVETFRSAFRPHIDSRICEKSNCPKNICKKG